MEKIDDASFLELEKQIRERFSEGDECIGFFNSGERGIQNFNIKYPLQLGSGRMSITDTNDWYIYKVNATTKNKFALNLSRGESRDLERAGKLNVINNAYSII